MNRLLPLLRLDIIKDKKYIYIMSGTPGVPTRKQKAFVDELLRNPQQSATQAALKIYNTTDRTAASVIAAKNLKSPQVLEYMNKYSDYAQKTVIQVMKNASKKKDNVQWQRLAKDSADSLLDRVHGKPVSKNENTNLNINIDTALDSLL